jgi:hypothetical protein
MSSLSIPPIQIPSIPPHRIRIYTPPPIPIPPIKIPTTSPHLHTVFDFPSPHIVSPTPSTSTSSISTQSWSSAISSIFLCCLQCEIPMSRVEAGSNPDICRSCETIQYDVRWKGKKMPSCMVCWSNAWRIHRMCQHAICHKCINNFEKCPSCKQPFE